jgi:hypothetical protein
MKTRHGFRRILEARAHWMKPPARACGEIASRNARIYASQARRGRSQRGLLGPGLGSLGKGQAPRQSLSRFLFGLLCALELKGRPGRGSHARAHGDGTSPDGSEPHHPQGAKRAGAGFEARREKSPKRFPELSRTFPEAFPNNSQPKGFPRAFPNISREPSRTFPGAFPDISRTVFPGWKYKCKNVKM